MKNQQNIKEYNEQIWEKSYFQIISISILVFIGVLNIGFFEFLGGLIGVGVISRILNKIFRNLKTSNKLLYSYSITIVMIFIIASLTTNFIFALGYLPMIFLWFLFDVFGFKLK